MGMLVDRVAAIFAGEPIDIYANPTHAPELLAAEHDKFWTPARLKKSAALIKLARQMTD
jgi:hypothetical protein